MIFWNILTYIDWTLFILMGMTVLYLGIFAITSLFARHGATPKAKKENRFIILIPSHHNGRSLEMTVKSVLGQSYPQRQFDVTVIADSEDEMTMFHLAQQPITLLTPTYSKSSRTKALQLAINNLPQFKIYDAVIILDAGDVVEPEFLEQINDAFEAAGTKAIQAHKVALNRDSTSARLSAVFEEINNSIFRRGHISVGLSSALSRSGIVFDFTWFKEYILDARAYWTEKELELTLLRQHIYIDYFDGISIYNEKTRQAEEFNREHRNWIWTQLHTFVRNVRYMPLAIINRQYDLIDKILQWMLIPRMLLMAVILIMSIVLPFIYISSAIKWWFLFAIILLIFAIATPNYLVDSKWNSTFFKIPFVLFSSTLKRFKVGRKILNYINLKD